MTSEDWAGFFLLIIIGLGLIGGCVYVKKTSETNTFRAACLKDGLPPSECLRVFP